MSAPLEIRPLKRLPFRVKRSAPNSYPPHPLEDPEDSDSDSVDLSFSDSIALSSLSGLWSLVHLPRAAAPVVLPTTAFKGPSLHVQGPAYGPTHGHLSGLLNGATYARKSLGHMAPMAHTAHTTHTTHTPASPATHTRELLPRRLSAWGRILPLALVGYAVEILAPRATDDSRPDECGGQELTTFSLRHPPCGRLARACKVRNRELRINCEFLHRYALDCSARERHLLPSCREDAEAMMRLPAMRRFDADYGLVRVLSLAREKLWDCVILAPRGDQHPGRTVDYDGYTFAGDDGVLPVTSRRGNYVPWATHRSRLKPAGLLRTAPSVLSRAAPTQRPTCAQYTIKGWCNDRWMPVT